MSVTFPNESPEYRTARNALLESEKALREQLEAVAKQRRELPPGGELKEDYAFHELVDGEKRAIRFSELFKPGDDTLFAYSFMYAPDMDEACPMCTAFLDSIDGQVVHLEQRISHAIIAKHDLDVLHEHAQSRGWRNLRLISSAGTSYNSDYHGEVGGRQMTTANVFRKDLDSGAIHHFWNTELAYHGFFENGGMRHIDLAWPLWNLLDMTPGGRGDLNPALAYDR